MGYKQKRKKLQSKLSDKSDELNDSIEQFGSGLEKIKENSDEKESRNPKRIKLEQTESSAKPVVEDFNNVFSDSDLFMDIKPEPSDELIDEMDYNQIKQYVDEAKAEFKEEEYVEYVDEAKAEVKEEECDLKPDWLEDDTVPKGWKRRILPGNGVPSFNNVPNLVSPDGRQFRSRQRALQSMLKKGADKCDIEEMSGLLVHEGWESHPMLPEGWKFRKSPKYSIQFLNAKANGFKSIKDATDEAARDYDEEAANRLIMFIEIQNVEKRMEFYDWKEDSSVPDGWKLRTAEGKLGKLYFLSPDGRMFPSRSIGLQHMIKENFLPEEIENMRLKLVEHDSWEINENLPTGWLFKQTYKGKTVNMMTSEGFVVESFSAAIEHIKSSEKYTFHDVNNIQRILSEKGIERRLESYIWEENQTIPQGWKMRTADSKTEKQYFLSPDGLSFPSRFVAYQHLIKENHSPSEIENIRMCLKYENWVDSPLLPRGWSHKENDGKHGMVFLSNNGIFFKSFLRAMKYAETCDRNEITLEDVERMKLFLEDVSIDRRIMGYNWQESETLPNGWKIRQFKGKVDKEYLLAPSGIQYQSRMMALIFLIENNFPKEDIEMMRTALNEEGWKDENLLPNKWKYKRNGKKEINFLTEEGLHFQGFKNAREFLASKFSSKEMENFEMFNEIESIRRRAHSYTWNKNDETIPEGWMSRTVDRKCRKSFFLSPDGIQFPCRRAALQDLLKNDADPEEISKLRSLLKHEGFETSTLLPENWVYRQVSCKDFKILTEEGHLFESFLATTEHMKSSGKFSSRHFVNLETFEKEKFQERISTLADWQEDKNLPEGWKSRTGEGMKAKRSFLSPSGIQFRNRRECIQYMIKEKYKWSDLEKTKIYLKFEGWEGNSNLPIGWLYRNTKSKSRGFLLSKEGELFDSIIAAKEYILNHDYDPTEADRLPKVLEESARNRRLSQVADIKSFNWVEDKNLPKGWKTQMETNGLNTTNNLMAPNGTSFESRETALQYMLREKYSHKEIQEMIISLKFDGWEENKNLPKGWMFKEKSSRSEKGVISHPNLISDEGYLFQSLSSAIEHMQLSQNYNNKQVQQIEKYFMRKTFKRKSRIEIWNSDNSLPKGWKSRIAEGKTGKVFFLAPDGYTFHTRKAGLVHMIKEGYKEDEIIFMRRSLTLEGFEENEHLPHGWIFRDNSTKNSGGISVSVTFITENGEVFESFSSVFDMIQLSSSYTEEDSSKLKLLMNEKSSLRRQTMAIWNYDENLPDGWKQRKAEGKTSKTFLLSPDGSQFPSRRAALLHMIKENFEEKSVTIMRKSLTFEGFEENSNLPSGWLFKENCTRNNSGISVGVVFITENGGVYESFSSVLEIMELSDNFDEEDILKLTILMEEKSSVRRKTMEIWLKDESLPAGWKLRKTEGKTGRIFYLSPNGDQFPSRRTALIHMIKEDFNNTDVSSMRKTLSIEGFEENKHLPKDWMFKENSSRNSSGISVSVTFITDLGEVYESFSSVLEMMRSNENYNESDINDLRRLMMEKASKRRKTNEAWEEDKSLPDGWMFRIADGIQGKVLFLSPDGTQFMSRKLAYKYLAKNNDQQGVKTMKDLLIKFEKWQEHDNLPAGWMYKENSNNALDKGKARVLYSYQFLTREGDFLEGNNNVVDFLNDSVDYNDEDVDRFNKLIPQRQAMRRVKIDKWIEDDTVPEGWKTRIGDGKEARKFFMNPEGKQFQTRRTALVHMIAKQSSAQDIESMRNGFQSEGWEEDENLPPKWMFRINFGDVKTSIRILTENGSVLDSFRTARDYISETDQHYVETFSSFELEYTRKMKSFSSANGVKL